MSKRTDKILSIVRYLTGRTGIPGIGSHGPDSTLMAPYPYQFQVTTDANLGRFAENFRRLEDVDPKQIPVIIRYDAYLGSPANAWTVMRLETFCRLAKLHYDSEIKGRGD